MRVSHANLSLFQRIRRLGGQGFWMLLCCALSFSFEAHSQTFPETPALSVSVEPAATNGAWWREGQILLVVRLVSRHPFDELSLPVILPDGVKSIEVMRPRTRQVRSYAGDGWAFETRLALFPLASGPLIVPAQVAIGAVRTGPEQILRFEQRSAPIKADVRDVPDAYDDPVWRVAKDITLTETWSTPPEEARKGDILRREIHATAQGMTGVQIRIPDMHMRPGIAVADLGGSERTEKTAEGVIGHASRAWNVEVAADAAVVFVPPFGFGYWHSETAERRLAALPGQRIEPRVYDSAAIAARLMDEARAERRGSAALLVALLTPIGLAFLGLLAFLGAAEWPRKADRALRRSLSEPTSRHATLRALRRWRRSATPSDPAALQAHALAEARTFAIDWTPQDAPDLARAVLAAAVRARRSAVRRKLRSFYVAVVGPRIPLERLDEGRASRKT